MVHIIITTSVLKWVFYSYISYPDLLHFCNKGKVSAAHWISAVFYLSVCPVLSQHDARAGDKQCYCGAL